MQYRKSKSFRKVQIQDQIQFDFLEYLDEINEYLCGCNCVICNPYYGDAYEYFILQDSWILSKKIN
jgi:hypothetical protein